MNSILSEKEYQKFILNYLEQNNGFTVRTNANYDRYYALDRELLFKFLDDTQPEKVKALKKIYKNDYEETLINYINTNITQKNGSLLEVLKHGIELSNVKLSLMYGKPASTLNPDLVRKYEKNIFSVAEEVWASDEERIDVVIFLNGFAIMSFELKCNMAGQSYKDAIHQYRTQRNPIIIPVILAKKD